MTNPTNPSGEQWRDLEEKGREKAIEFLRELGYCPTIHERLIDALVSSFESVDTLRRELQTYIDRAILADKRTSEAENREAYMKLGFAKEDRDICQTAGKVLGYPWFKDDLKNFPDATEADGVCVGDHVAASIVAELADKYSTLEKEREEARKALEWQPIESAPKDGTRLMLLCDDELEVGYWSRSIWVLAPGKDGAWIIYENRSDTVELRPTHWMHIPKFQSALNEKGEK